MNLPSCPFLYLWGAGLGSVSSNWPLDCHVLKNSQKSLNHVTQKRERSLWAVYLYLSLFSDFICCAFVSFCSEHGGECKSAERYCGGRRALGGGGWVELQLHRRKTQIIHYWEIIGTVLRSQGFFFFFWLNFIVSEVKTPSLPFSSPYKDGGEVKKKEKANNLSLCRTPERIKVSFAAFHFCNSATHTFALILSDLLK